MALPPPLPAEGAAAPEAAASEAGQDPRPWARDDLLLAVRTALETDGWLLTAGEQQVATTLLELRDDALSLYARLNVRRGVLFRVDRLAYEEVPDIPAAARALVDAGFAWDGARSLPAAMLAQTLTVEELKAACRQLKRPTRGRRAQLLERLADAAARPVLVRPSLMLRHAGLFRRLARLYFGSRHGDLSRLVLVRMDLLRPVSYTPTGGAGVFPDRRSLLAWEHGVRIDALLHQLPTPDRRRARVERLAQDLEIVASCPPPPPWRARFSARRLAAERLTRAARQLERLGRPDEAVTVYRSLRDHGVRRVGEVSHRLALALDAAGHTAQAAALCADSLEELPATETVAVARTGRRLARKAGVGWRPLPPLRKARTRALKLKPAALGGPRPLWQTAVGPLPIEAALIHHLADLGRTAVHAEGTLWRTLFGLLFVDALFAPVPGMLPTPLRAGPLDLGAPGFVTRRADLVADGLAAIAAGQAEARLTRTWQQRQGELIAGVAWNHAPLPLLQRIARDLGGSALAAVLEVVAHDWRIAPRGLPDLVVLGGPEVRLPAALPSRLGTGALLAEVKGPGDQLRDAQRVWLDRLLAAGVPAELWTVTAAPDERGAE